MLGTPSVCLRVVTSSSTIFAFFPALQPDFTRMGCDARPEQHLERQLEHIESHVPDESIVGVKSEIIAPDLLWTKNVVNVGVLFYARFWVNRKETPLSGLCLWACSLDVCGPCNLILAHADC